MISWSDCKKLWPFNFNRNMAKAYNDFQDNKSAKTKAINPTISQDILEWMIYTKKANQLDYYNLN